MRGMNRENEIAWTFKNWITKFKDVDLIIGDLAKEIVADGDFPDDDDLSEILEYLLAKNIDYVLIEDFCTIWNFYLVSAKRN